MADKDINYRLAYVVENIPHAEREAGRKARWQYIGRAYETAKDGRTYEIIRLHPRMLVGGTIILTDPRHADAIDQEQSKVEDDDFPM
jgi:hypothetical protein